jgi:hypothetical protein
MAAALFIAVLLGCGDPTGPGWEERPAVLVSLEIQATLDGSDPTVNPASVLAGTPLTVIVVSGGSSSCSRPGPVTTRASSSQLLLDVRDFWATNADACTEDLMLYERRLLHTFFTGGEKTIRAIGDGPELVRVLTVVE